MRSSSRGTDGPPPCAPQRKERLDPPVPEGEPGMGLDGEGGNRESHSARHESADASQGALEGFEQPAWPAADRITDPSAVAVLQRARRTPGPVGLLGEARGDASEVGGPWPRASKTWRPRGSSTACGTPRPWWRAPLGSVSSATTIRTA